MPCLRGAFAALGLHLQCPKPGPPVAAAPSGGSTSAPIGRQNGATERARVDVRRRPRSRQPVSAEAKAGDAGFWLVTAVAHIRFAKLFGFFCSLWVTSGPQEG
jgi:hypothetical protein